MWLGGSQGRKVIIAVGGQWWGRSASQIGTEGQYAQIGVVQLGAGAQAVKITRPAATLAPGNRRGATRIGPLVLAADDAPPAVSEVPAAQAHSLCHRALQVGSKWCAEALSPPAEQPAADRRPRVRMAARPGAPAAASAEPAPHRSSGGLGRESAGDVLPCARPEAAPASGSS